MSSPDIPALHAVPDPVLAARIASEVAGSHPVSVRRFPTGTRHYVYEAGFADHAPVVVRIGDRTAAAEMEGAIFLSGLLRPRGLPLPLLLAHDTGGRLPWMVLERLPGTDLGDVIAKLSPPQLDCIAREVARAQAITATTPAAHRFGYAARPEMAPFSCWSEVLDASLARSRQRLVQAGLFDPALVDGLQALIEASRAELDQVLPVPFLHDTTTKNVIVGQDGCFSGIVDVDDLCFGDPRYPAALTLAVFQGYGGPPSYVEAWLGHAGLMDDRIFRLYVSSFLLGLMSDHGQVFNGNEPSPSKQTRNRLTAAFQASLPAIRA